MNFKKGDVTTEAEVGVMQLLALKARRGLRGEEVR